MNLKIKDVVVQQFEGGYTVAQITVNGKTGVRNVRLYKAYPFFREWVSNGHHPFPSNPNAPLFCGTGKKNTGRRLSLRGVQCIYERYQKRHFPQLLEDPTVSPEDKRKIADLLKKRWNLHNRRHTATTEISKTLKDPVLVKQYMGWTQKSNTLLKYQHYFNDDAMDAMLQADGLPTIIASGGANNKKGLLKPKICPNCEESNKPDSKFCAKCKFVLSYDLYNEVTNEAEETKKKLAQLEAQQQEKFKEMQEQIESLRKIALKQAFKVIEKEVESNPIPYIEGADKMTVNEVLFEMQKRGCNTLAFDDSK